MANQDGKVLSNLELALLETTGSKPMAWEQRCKSVHEHARTHARTHAVTHPLRIKADKGLISSLQWKVHASYFLKGGIDP